MVKIQCGDIVALCAGRCRGTLLADLVKRIPNFLMGRIFVVHQKHLTSGEELPNSDYTLSEILHLTLQRQAITFILADKHFTNLVQTLADVFIIEDSQWQCAAHVSSKLGCEVQPYKVYTDINVVDKREPVEYLATV